jgi:hypothetical protein
MERVRSMSLKSRVAVCFVLIVISVLMLGAGKITEKLRERNASKELEKEQWTELISVLGRELPREHRERWANNAPGNPQLFLRSCTVRLRAISKTD